jgi:integrase
MPKTGLLEPSFDDVLMAVEQSPDLPMTKRSAWSCSLRQIAKALGRVPAEIPARWTSARFAIGRLHAARVGANPKTLANHKSNVRAAVLWFAGATNLPTRGVPLSPEWAVLRNLVADRRARAILYPFMRYCSAKAIAPSATNEATLDSYMQYRAEATALASNAAARRSIARRWNACRSAVEGWPERLLSEPPVKAIAGPAWDEFPQGLRDDIEAHLKGMTKVRKRPNGKRIRGCGPSTIRRCRAELVAAARKAVKIGVPIENLTSLRALVHPDVAERVLDAYWEKDGEHPKIYTIDLGWKLLAIARQLGLPEEELERLDEARAALDEHRPDDLMTEKNKAVIRYVTTTDVWREVVRLPEILMKEAHEIRHQAPVKAAVMAQIAVAIAILTFAPIRLGNLARIKLDENLIRPGMGQALLVFRRYDVKNLVDLEFPLDAGLAGLIADYIDNFRHTLLRGGKGGWLFPGEELPSKHKKTLSEQISDRIIKALGFSITVHQFRHAAAALWLKHHPGDYETVRRMLGHRNIQTTIRFYIGLETKQANSIFGGLVRDLIEFAPESESAL